MLRFSTTPKLHCFRDDVLVSCARLGRVGQEKGEGGQGRGQPQEEEEEEEEKEQEEQQPLDFTLSQLFGSVDSCASQAPPAPPRLPL